MVESLSKFSLGIVGLLIAANCIHLAGTVGPNSTPFAYGLFMCQEEYDNTKGPVCLSQAFSRTMNTFVYVLVFVLLQEKAN